MDHKQGRVLTGKMETRLALFLTLLLVVSLVLPDLAVGEKAGASIVHPKRVDPKMQYEFSEGSLHPQECAPRCTTRCSKTSFKKPCMFFCQKCCAKCLCVPPGTYGNKQLCPCYNNWKTKEGGPKCP